MKIWMLRVVSRVFEAGIKYENLLLGSLIFYKGEIDEELKRLTRSGEVFEIDVNGLRKCG